ncbi:MAG: helix-hairpin-helix domain-containing protein, partial [Cytophagales bacterium]|nr:helix-hairpin-helix domain-containing protein [Cytophagales bacterium]
MLIFRHLNLHNSFNKKGAILVAIFFTVLLSVNAQDPVRKEVDLENFIQDLFKVQDQDLPYEDLYETLFQYYRTPLNINKATKEELRNLYILSEIQINSFFEHKRKYGALLSLYELQTIPNFDQSTIDKLLPFVTIGTDSKLRDNRPLLQRIKEEHENHFLLLRFRSVLEKQKGYTNPTPTSSGEIPQRYVGSPGAWYLRYRLSHSNDFSFGITLEKDAGEAFAWNPAKRYYGTDFISAHATLYNIGHWKSISVGDYTVQLGQGLIMSGGFYIGKGSETISTIRRSTMGIKPYTSVFEGNFFRGAAATYNWKRFDITALISHRKIDGRLAANSDTINNNDDYLSSLLNTGMHRTPSELDSRQTIDETNVGGNINYTSKSKNLNIGLSALNTRFGTPLQRIPSTYNQFEFNGINNFIFGGDISFSWQNFNFFGEVARSQSGGIGAVAGAIASLTHKLDVSILYRNYDKNFHSLYSNSFNEGTRNINEEGIYWGVKYKPNKIWEWNTYFDLFRFPWLKFRVDAPSSGYEFLSRLNYKPSKTVTLQIQYREENKQRNSNNDQVKIDYLATVIKRNVMVNAEFKIARSLTFRSRVQGSSFTNDGSMTYGFAIVQDLNYDFGKLAISTRYSLFDTDDYDNRQYVYEKNVLYTFSIPAYYGKGYRVYLLVQYTFHKKLDVWARIA